MGSFILIKKPPNGGFFVYINFYTNPKTDTCSPLEDYKFL